MSRAKGRHAGWRGFTLPALFALLFSIQTIAMLFYFLTTVSGTEQNMVVSSPTLNGNVLQSVSQAATLIDRATEAPVNKHQVSTQQPNEKNITPSQLPTSQTPDPLSFDTTIARTYVAASRYALIPASLAAIPITIGLVLFIVTQFRDERKQKLSHLCPSSGGRRCKIPRTLPPNVFPIDTIV